MNRLAWKLLGPAALLAGVGMGTACGSSPSSGAGRAGEGGAGQSDATTNGSSGADSSPGEASPAGDDSASDDGGLGLDGSGASSGSSGSGSSGSSGGGGGDGAACTPATGCPSGATCGRYVDPCSGTAFVCGSACTGGKVCTGSGGAQSCQMPSCTNRCGVLGTDPCGVPIGCGGCGANKACVNNACVPEVTVDASATCLPPTCTPDSTTHLCGTVAGLCGNTISCTCPAGQQCTGGVCGPPPPECGGADGGGLRCGTVPNACGSGNVRCAACPAGTQCSAAGTCDSCPAPSCGTATCGTAKNACGAAVSCGPACGTNEVCSGGSCCTPSTCAEAMDAGMVTGCAPVDLGCGVRAACSLCDAGEVCTSDTCGACVPKTCQSYGNAGCGHAIGCGSTQTLDCCAPGTTCMGDICCAPGQIVANGICCSLGQVNYRGTCCTPTCDPNAPAGGQVSCGVTIYCEG